MNEKFERLIERAEALMARIESVLPQPLAAQRRVHGDRAQQCCPILELQRGAADDRVAIARH